MKRFYAVFVCMALIANTYADETKDTISLGYLSVEKAEINSSVVTLSADELTDVTTTDIGAMLQGKVAGLQVICYDGQPGSTAEMIFRGASSFSGFSSPVFVVDGVLGGRFNPYDVETISVLKDAGSNAIYGVAASGVIVVTTKSGHYNTKPQVTVRSSVGAAMPQFGNFVPMKSEELYNYHKSLYSESEFNDKYPALSELPDYNWLDEYFHSGLIQNHYVSVAGGSQHVGYYASLNYYGEEGTLRTTRMQKVAGHAALKANVAKWLDLNAKVDLNKSWTRLPADRNTMLRYAYYTAPWAATPGEENIYRDNWKNIDKNHSVFDDDSPYYKSNNFNFIGSLQLNFHITDWLHFTTTNTIETNDLLTGLHMDTTGMGYPWNTLRDSRTKDLDFSTSNILKAAYRWDDHSVNGLVGGEYSLRNICYDTDTLKYNALDIFAQLGYDYDKRYFINASYQYGTVNLYYTLLGILHSLSNGAHQHYPSISAGWLISNEEFMKNQNVVSYLKLRANYGVAMDYGAQTSVYSSYSTNLSAIYPDLRHTIAAGIDLNLINRIDMSIDLYHTEYRRPTYAYHYSATEILVSREGSEGIRNRGIEYRLDAKVLNTDDLHWDIGFNIAFNQNKIIGNVYYARSYRSGSVVLQQDGTGDDLYTWHMREWAGVDPENGDPQWYAIDDKGNKTTTNDYTQATGTTVGRATPLFFGGLNTQFSWKGLALSINTNFTYGNKIYNRVRQTMDDDGHSLYYHQTMNQLSMDNNRLGWSRWTQPGDIATHPKIVFDYDYYASNTSSRYLEDGSYFRLKNITPSYDFCATLIQKKYISKCRVFVSADNVATATRFSGVNPEANLSSAGNGLPGMYNETYPLARTIVGGIELVF